MNTLKILQNKSELSRHLIRVNLACLALAALCMVLFDQSFSQYFAQEHVVPYRQFARQITDVGLSEHYFIGSLFLYLYFRWLAPTMKLWRQNEKKADFIKKWALNFFVALITSGILVLLMKFIVGRQRPHKSAPLFDPYVFVPFSTHWHWNSFPSGHSQTMFTVATMMSIAFPKLKHLWILLAAIACFTRIVVHDHFLSDTIYGACVGYTGTMIAIYLMRKHTKQGLI